MLKCSNGSSLANNIDLQTKKYDLMDAEQDLVASRAEFAP